MRWFSDLNTRNKLFVGFGILILFLLLIIVNAYQTITILQTTGEQIFEKQFTIAVNLKDVRTNQNGNRAALLQLLVADDEDNRNKLFAEIGKRTEELEQNIDPLFELLKDDEDAFKKLTEFNDIRIEYQNTRENVIIPLIKSNSKKKSADIVMGIQEERNRKMSSLIDELVAKADADAEKAVRLADETTSQSLKLLGVLATISLSVSVGFVLLFGRLIGKPIKVLSDAANKISDGDLTFELTEINSTDELGSLTRAFGKMVVNLRNMIAEVKEGINILVSSTKEIAAMTSQVAKGATETATSVSETTATVEEVKQTSQVSSQKAKAVSASAQKAAEVSKKGEKAVETTVNGINSIKNQMESIAQRIIKLSEQSQAIGEIIATVNELAEQSNLLAVNAAIEAARAGEQGKGFAVVAQEVKSLAEQSKQSTAQIRKILLDIQKATSEVVMAAEQGSKAVVSGVEQAEKAGDAIRQLTESITEAAQAALQIAASSQQQLAGINQVTTAMENINQASSQNVAGTKQAESAAQNLNDLAQKLNAVIAQYNV